MPALTAKQKREQREAAAAAAKEQGGQVDTRSPEQQEQARDAAEARNQSSMQRPDQVLSDDVIRPSSAGAKVAVACKIGVGWFDLQVAEKKTVYENTQTGPRPIEQYFPLPKVVRIRGTAYPRGTPPEGFPARPEMVGGYALTHGVDKDFWDAWIAQQEKSPYVINHMIFGDENVDRLRGKCRELSGTTSGLEPLDVRKAAKGGIVDPRVAKSSMPGVESVETEAGRAAKIG